MIVELVLVVIFMIVDGISCYFYDSGAVLVVIFMIVERY